MRIVKAFVVIFASTILFLLPLTNALYDFKTDQQKDEYSVPTAVGQTSDNVAMSELLYDSDTSTMTITSDLATDALSWSSYNASGPRILVSGLTANTTRILTATYDVDALGGNTAVQNLADVMPWAWLLCIIAFAPVSLVYIWIGRD